MLANDNSETVKQKCETTNTTATSIQGRNDIEKSTWKTNRYFVNFVKSISCRNFHVESMP